MAKTAVGRHCSPTLGLGAALSSGRKVCVMTIGPETLVEKVASSSARVAFSTSSGPEMPGGYIIPAAVSGAAADGARQD